MNIMNQIVAFIKPIPTKAENERLEKLALMLEERAKLVEENRKLKERIKTARAKINA
jgi:hypothetical protein